MRGLYVRHGDVCRLGPVRHASNPVRADSQAHHVVTDDDRDGVPGSVQDDVPDDVPDVVADLFRRNDVCESDAVSCYPPYKDISLYNFILFLSSSIAMKRKLPLPTI